MITDEIEKAQRQVKTDAYQMSVGEIVNMYKEGELVINPDFQRLFRWEVGQKSKLIESILLGIPVPSIFVFEKEDSKWELIDGLQRISTLLEFMGLLRAPETNVLLPPSILEGTTYLPSLHNVVWERVDQINEVPAEQQNELEKHLQLSIRRSRITVEILKRPSSNNTKYDLFQRLNAGGTPANPQELRNCVVIMANSGYFQFMKILAVNKDFLAVSGVTPDQIEKQKHFELLSRFLVHTYVDYDGNLDVEEFIDQGLINLAIENKTNEAESCFNATFALLSSVYGGDALRRITGGVASGRVGLAAFECIAIGIARNIKHICALKEPKLFIQKRIEDFWKSSEFNQFFTAGTRGTTRIQKTIPYGQNWFAA
ncbi:MAG: GmrSD restriction endonuclease domain-containing protein [Prosthecobacter sp.]